MKRFYWFLSMLALAALACNLGASEVPTATPRLSTTPTEAATQAAGETPASTSVSLASGNPTRPSNAPALPTAVSGAPTIGFLTVDPSSPNADDPSSRDVAAGTAVTLVVSQIQANVGVTFYSLQAGTAEQVIGINPRPTGGTVTQTWQVPGAVGQELYIRAEAKDSSGRTATTGYVRIYTVNAQRAASQLPTLASTPGTLNLNCPASLPSRLVQGGTARVTLKPGNPNVLRDKPGRNSSGSTVIGSIPAGGVFTVVVGPQCMDGFAWWQVDYNGRTGWTAEGEGTTYWLEPLSVGTVSTVAAAPDCLPNLPPRLAIGGMGRVTPGLDNLIRDNPGRTGTRTVGRIPAGGLFTVVGGSQCVDNVRWWQVNYNNVIGWTGEGEGTTYWAEPVVDTSSCSASIPPRLKIGGAGKVLPGTPNALRSQPARTSGTVINSIPGGAIFGVADGPRCGDGIWWWLVNYNGQTGWTGEGEGSAYWVEPTTDSPSSVCSTSVPPRLVVGGAGQVLPGTPNALRSLPARTSGSVIGSLPGGATFDVIEGPRCGDGIWWWQVRYGNLVGWTGEGEGAAYWVAPVSR